MCPVYLGLSRAQNDLYLFPLEPLISVKGRNVITERQIAKNRGVGSVKEQFGTGDYTIEIRGMLQNKEGTYPESDITKLTKLFTAGKSLVIVSQLTSICNIELMCVTEWEFPETPGLENQAFVIRGVSDEDFQLLT
ncbi:hypothetical protein DYU11_18500 [Fibrisoma montanum]|uniref:DUF6046 domain-containing protein n=2 Tax=Fibrisoma montanum TaxID=2305895 RepID=A0A418M649_9BACT|nr:hypothetical protein DYU11_18500 [Fibrisoma montanum]